MRMRQSLFSSIAVVLVACGLHPSPTPAGPSTVPICTENAPPAGVPRVRVVIASSGVARPETCTVRSGTEVVWELRGAPFMLKFKAVPGHAAPDWQRGELRRFAVDDPNLQFPSSPFGGQEEVRLIAKEVSVEETIGYCVALSATCTDPGIKIQPR